MTGAPDPAEVARLLALVEEALRGRGFGGRAIQRARKANRAQIAGALESSKPCSKGTGVVPANAPRPVSNQKVHPAPYGGDQPRGNR